MSLTKVFVYGTLKAGRPLDRPLFRKLRTKVSEATIEGAIYNLGWFPGVRLDEKGVVYGEVHEFHADDIKQILEHMDYIEGYSAKYDRGMYLRKIVSAVLSDGGKTEAYVYEFGRAIPQERRLKDGLWEPSKN